MMVSAQCLTFDGTDQWSEDLREIMSEETLSSPKQIYVDDESVDECETMAEQSNIISYEIALNSFTGTRNHCA